MKDTTETYQLQQRKLRQDAYWYNSKQKNNPLGYQSRATCSGYSRGRS
jgi:hypothetical protein